MACYSPGTCRALGRHILGAPIQFVGVSSLDGIPPGEEVVVVRNMLVCIPISWSTSLL